MFVYALVNSSPLSTDDDRIVPVELEMKYAGSVDVNPRSRYHRSLSAGGLIRPDDLHEGPYSILGSDGLTRIRDGRR
jgi:hypothetical protein